MSYLNVLSNNRFCGSCRKFELLKSILLSLNVCFVYLADEIESIEKDVQGHEVRVKEALRSIGLDRISLFTVCLKRAAFALCEDYDGPGQQERQYWLERCGRRGTLRRSGLDSVIRFLDTFLDAHAQSVRILSIDNYITGKKDDIFIGSSIKSRVRVRKIQALEAESDWQPKFRIPCRGYPMVFDSCSKIICC